MNQNTPSASPMFVKEPSLAYFYAPIRNTKSRTLSSEDCRDCQEETITSTGIITTTIGRDVFIFEEWRMIAGFLPRSSCFGGLAAVSRKARLAVLSVHFIRNSAVVKTFAHRWIWAQSIGDYCDKLPNNRFIEILKPLQEEYYDLHQFIHPSEDKSLSNHFPIPNYYSLNLIKTACTVGNKEIILQLIEKPFLFENLTLKSTKYFKLAFMNCHNETATAFAKTLLSLFKSGNDISKLKAINPFIVPRGFQHEFEIVSSLFRNSENSYQHGIIRISYESLHSQLIGTCQNESFKLGWTTLLNAALFNVQFTSLIKKSDFESAQFIIERLHQLRNGDKELFKQDLNQILVQLRVCEQDEFLIWFFDYIGRIGEGRVLSDIIFDNLNTILHTNTKFFDIYMNRFPLRDAVNDESRLYRYIDELNTNYTNLCSILDVTKVPYDKVVNHLNSCAQYYLVNFGHVLVAHYETEIASLILDNISLFLLDSKIHSKKRALCLTHRVQTDLVHLFLNQQFVDWNLIVELLEKNPFMSTFMEIIVSVAYNEFVKSVLDKIYSTDSDDNSSRKRFIFKSFTRYIEKEVYDFCALLMFACNVDKSFMKALLERNEYLILKIHSSFEPFENIPQMIERCDNGSFELISHDLQVLECLCNSSLKVFVNVTGSLWPLSNNFLSLTFKILDESYEPIVRNNINDIRNIIRRFIGSSQDIDTIISHFKTTIHQEEILNVLMGLPLFTKNNFMTIPTPVLGRTKLTLDSLSRIIDIIYDNFEDCGLEQKLKDCISISMDNFQLSSIKYHPKAIELFERMSYRHLFESSYYTFFQRIEQFCGRGNITQSEHAQQFWGVHTEPYLELSNRNAIMNLLSQYETIDKNSKWKSIIKGLVSDEFIDEALEILEEKKPKPPLILEESSLIGSLFGNNLEETKKKEQSDREKQLSFISTPLFNFTFDFGKSQNNSFFIKNDVTTTSSIVGSTSTMTSTSAWPQLSFLQFKQ